MAALYALFSRGHCLLVGVPGLAKTLLVQTLARSLELSFSRIQFTPDLMPSDITGTEILEEDAATGHRRFVFGQRAGLHAGAAGGRNQPHAAQDAGGVAGGDAGEDGDGGRQDVSAGGAVHGAGDAEPDRAGGDLSVAGGAVGPVPVRGAGGVSHAGRGEQGGGAAFLHAAGAAAAGADARGGAELPPGHRAGAGGAERDRLLRCGWCGRRAR